MKTLVQFLKLLIFLATWDRFAEALPRHVAYEPVGCYRDNQVKPRPLPELIANLRSTIDWNHMNKTIDRCARFVQKKGYEYFGLQFYGECWSGDEKASTSYFRDGTSQRCVAGVGQNHANYVYKLSSKTPVPASPTIPTRTESLGRECSNYQILQSTTRGMKYENRSVLECDRRLRPGWYRIARGAGTQVPTTCVPKFRCGTQAPGWLAGTHPDLAEGIVDRVICFHWRDNCCHFRTQVKVRNCGTFYVYKFSSLPDACDLRICGNGGEVPPTSAPICKPPTTAPTDPCSSYKELNSVDRAMGFHDPTITKCDKSLSPGWYRFTGGSGTQMASRCVRQNHCGTQAPGWLNGRHPGNGLEVTRQVCFNWKNNCCFFKSDVTVRNCGGSYYVYKISVLPSVCSLRMCGNGTGLETTKPPTSAPISTRPPVSECSSYETLDSFDRSVTFSNSSVMKCDYYLIQGWFRLMGNAGTRLANKCPAIGSCGTRATGWLQGSHPGISDGTVTRKVCFHWTSGCCQWSVDVRVRNCGGYYVYELPPVPACHLRYCGNITSNPLAPSSMPATVKLPTSASTALHTTTGVTRSTTVTAPVTATHPPIATSTNQQPISLPTTTPLPVRLVGGTFSSEGRVEVWYNGQWGTICDDQWTLKGAHVICHMLGYPRALTAPRCAHYGPGQGEIWLDDVSCHGNELSINECRHRGWGVHNCRHSEDASVVCEDLLHPKRREKERKEATNRKPKLKISTRKLGPEEKEKETTKPQKPKPKIWTARKNRPVIWTTGNVFGQP